MAWDLQPRLPVGHDGADSIVVPNVTLLVATSLAHWGRGAR